MNSQPKARHRDALTLPSGPEHGGDLDTIRQRFPAAPLPWIDLSTGINPWPYPVPDLPLKVWHRLPGRADEDAVRTAAAAYYGANADEIVLAPGSQALIQWLPRLRPHSRVAVLGPTYGEHAWSWSASDHDVVDVPLRGPIPEDIDVLVVTRPNNPDGTIVPLPMLADWADRLDRRGGWLIVDEAFADISAPSSVAATIPNDSLIVLRSFGKFFGLAGCRLGVAIARGSLRVTLRNALGPWCVPGPTLAIARHAFADEAWIADMRERIARQAARLDEAATGGGLRLIGGTNLFRLYESTNASAVFSSLASAGIFVRRFTHHPTWLRFGLPASEEIYSRITGALSAVGSCPSSVGPIPTK